ncbi:MAG: AAA family ATPase [Pseudomonadota bacterium]
MYLHNLKLWNFRKYGLCPKKGEKEITNENFGLKIEFQPGLNVLVGENDSGKTAVIDAIRYLLDTNSQERTWITEDDFHVGVTCMRIEACFKFSENENAIETCAPFVEHLSTEEGKPILYVTLLAQITQRKMRGIRFIDRTIKSGVNGTGNSIEGEIRAFLRTTYLKPLRDAALEMSSGHGSRLSQILAGHKKIQDSKEKLIDIMVEANQNIEKNEVIADTEKTINDNYFQKLRFEKDNLSTKIKMADVKSSKDLNDAQKYLFLKRILERLNLNLSEGENDVFTAHGLGYNNLMYMATEMLLIQQEKGENLPLLLIEEPEAHLHPQMQLQLLEFLKSQNGVKTILTTHSPILASKVPLDSMLLLADNKVFDMRKGKTRLDKDDYHFLEKFLDATKANLFFARGVIIVEGDAENILFPVIAKLLDCPLEKNGISIVNVGHTGLFRFSRILQREHPDKDGQVPIMVACVADRDLRPDIVAFEEDCEKSDIKYIKKTDKNKTSFESFYDGSIEEKKLDVYINKKKENDGQNVKTFVSPSWTLEYDIAHCGLKEEMHQAIGTKTAFEEINTGTNAEISARIYKPLTGGKSKSETAYQLARILEYKYWDKKNNKPRDTEELKCKLPKYILQMYEHVSGKVLTPVEKNDA